MGANEITIIVGTVVNTGFAGVVGWYLLTKALPKMQETYLESIERQQKEYTASQALQRTQYIESAKEQREQYAESTREQRVQYLSSIDVYRKWFDEREQRGINESKVALQVVMQHCEKEAKLRDDTLKIEMNLIIKSINDFREVMEELRDQMQLQKRSPLDNSNITNPKGST